MPKTLKSVLAVVSLAGYIFIAFFLERYDHYPLMGAYFLLFCIYIYQLKNLSEYRTKEIFSYALLLRVAIVIALPNLSDDFYRFIWDGRILSSGHNPFQYLPAEALAMDLAPNITHDLYYRLNSPGVFTVYPPLVQFIFMTATSLFPNDSYGSVLVMKGFALLAEAGLLTIMIRLLRKLNLATRYVAIYALNPLVILEITGNLHHEGIMLFFFCGAVYLLMKFKYLSSAVMWGLAVATKLLPLIYLPVLFRRLTTQRLITYFAMVLLVTCILFLPLVEGMVQGMGESLSLYFQKFEFNASLYYVVREIGFIITGYNIIGTVGPLLGVIMFVLIILYSLKMADQSNLFITFTWVMTIFLIFSTTVHPWYIISLICFSAFTGYLFPIVWSLLIFMTYLGYGPAGYSEVSLVVLFEYLVVFGIMGYEINLSNNKSMLYSFINLDPRYMPVNWDEKMQLKD